MVDWGMSETSEQYKEALISGAVASVLSAVVLAACGQIENRRPAGPINGPSQWVHGRAAARVRKASVRHTLTGFVIHHLMATGWALLHERLLGSQKARQNFPARLARAALTATAANVVDFQLTPRDCSRVSIRSSPADPC
jgi:hypothetical protein